MCVLFPGLPNLFSLQDSLRLLAVWHALPGLAPGFCTQPPILSLPSSSLLPPLQAVLVHQLSKGASQNPFRKNRGRVVRVLFHPAKPFFFVATQQNVSEGGGAAWCVL